MSASSLHEACELLAKMDQPTLLKISQEMCKMIHVEVEPGNLEVGIETLKKTLRT